MTSHRDYKSALSERPSASSDRFTTARFNPPARPSAADLRLGGRTSLSQRDDTDIADLLRGSRSGRGSPDPTRGSRFASPDLARVSGLNRDSPDLTRGSRLASDGADPTRGFRLSRESSDPVPGSRLTRDSPDRVPGSRLTRDSPDRVPGSRLTRDSPDRVPGSRLTRDSPDRVPGSRLTRDSPDRVPGSRLTHDSPDRVPGSRLTRDSPDLVPGSRPKRDIPDPAGDTYDFTSSLDRRPDNRSGLRLTDRGDFRESGKVPLSLTDRRPADLKSSDDLPTRKNAVDRSPTKTDRNDYKLKSLERKASDPVNDDRFTSSLNVDLGSRNLRDVGVFTQQAQEPMRKSESKRGSVFGDILEADRKEKKREQIERDRKSERDSLESPVAKFTRPTSGSQDRSPAEREKKKPMPRKRKQPVTANLSATRYEVVRYCAEKAGFVLTREDDMNSYLTWVDSFASTDKVAEMKSYQRINHFPNMGEICRKDALCRNMARMAKEQPEEYNFVPKTWNLPSEYSTFMQYARDLKKKKKAKTFIAKPANGAMGNGIQLYRNPEKIPSNDNYIVQEYVDKPFLIDGFKCDMRIYVLVTHCDPLRVFLFHDGLLRLGTEKYILPTDANIDQLYMHLTNYSINKHSENYEKAESVNCGSKRSLKFLNEYLRKHDYDVAFLWRNIVEVIVKTLVVAHPHVLHAYRMCRPGQPVGSDSVCFEILGFDIILDRKMKPWLLEVNRSPSFGTDEKIDHQIKSALLNDTLRLLNIKASDKRKNIAAQKADAQKRLLRPVKRVEKGTSDAVKRKMEVERRKEELKDLLKRVRRDASREEYENRNCGRFQRIFPPDDKFRQEKYTALLSTAFSLFLSNRSGTLQREIELTYNNKLKEVDILDMLAQYESDEVKPTNQRRPSTPSRKTSTGIRKPLTSLPLSQPDADDATMSSDDGGRALSSRRSRPLSRTHSLKTISTSRDDAKNRSKSLPRASDPIANSSATMTPREREQETLKKTLIALNEMRIRFPGKSNEEADMILDKIHENWKHHKPKVASYWLVKLDSVKRRKVIDIVRSNVRSAVQRTWRVNDVDSLKLTRTFGRVFNRLLWSHGQGLWNCFTTSGTSWEVIFSKSSDVISTVELNCCRRIVQLCKDCLLIVYQFASDAKALQPPSESQNERFQRGRKISSGFQKME